MYISLKDSCAKGFKKWSDAQQPEINKDVCAGEGYGVVATDHDLDNRAMTSPELPHRPWLSRGRRREESDGVDQMSARVPVRAMPVPKMEGLHDTSGKRLD
jgi:hypothetical protein